MKPSKIIDLTVNILKRNQIAPPVIRQIVEEMNLAAQPEPGEEKPPAVKKQFVVLLSVPPTALPLEELCAWVLQIPENDSPDKVTRSIADAAATFNASKKGRLLPVLTVGEAIEHVPNALLKGVEVWVKTKTPVLVVTTSNKLED